MTKHPLSCWQGREPSSKTMIPKLYTGIITKRPCATNITAVNREMFKGDVKNLTVLHVEVQCDNHDQGKADGSYRSQPRQNAGCGGQNPSSTPRISSVPMVVTTNLEAKGGQSLSRTQNHDYNFVRGSVPVFDLPLQVTLVASGPTVLG